MIVWILIIVGIILIAGISYLLSLPGAYHVSKSRTMNVPVEQVFDRVLDFQSWSEWSPWIMHDADTHLEFSDKITEVGGYYSWESRTIGSGKMTHAAIDKSNHIEQKIEFIKPFRSVCKITWDFTHPQEDQIEITWGMQGKMPFLFRFMTKNVKKMVGLDYEMGLLMLNHLLDKKSDKFEMEFVGETTRSDSTVIYEACSGSKQSLPETMEKAFGGLFEKLKEKNIKNTGPSLTAYHKVNIGKDHFVYDCAFPVDPSDDSDSQSLIKSYPGGKYFKVCYRGSYNYMEHAWYASMSHLRITKRKFDKSRPCLEVYEVEKTTAKTPNDYVTDIYLPIK